MTVTRLCIQRARLLFRLRARQSCTRLYGTGRKRSWFDRFLTPKEEQELYFSITSAFRDNLAKQSSQSTQSYSNIIEQVILTGHTAPATTIPVDRLNGIKQRLDDPTTTVRELEQLWREMDKGRVGSVAMYNRLIRALIRRDALPIAEQVFQQLKLMPTTRTFTYLIDAHVKPGGGGGDMDKARQYVKQMQFLDQQRVRHAFDYNVLLRYYIHANEPHAVDLLWNDMQHAADTVKPGWNLYSQYMDWLATRRSYDALARLVSQLPNYLPTPPPRSAAHAIQRAANALLSAPEAPPRYETLANDLRRRIDAPSKPHP